MVNENNLQKFLSIIKDLRKEIMKNAWDINKEDLEFMFHLDKNGKPVGIKDPNAFFIGALVDRQIPAEKAWAFPRELYKRLGHLDIEKIAKISIQELYEIISKPPKMHRFPRQISKSLIESCKLLVEKYSGDAENIWKDVKSTKELKRRLKEFPGIGDKIANMIIRILVDFFGYNLNTSSIDLPSDRHIVRVLYRLGFINKIDGKEAIIFARKVYPEYPAYLDEPLFYIGITFCHNRNPKCKRCSLNTICSYFKKDKEI